MILSKKNMKYNVNVVNFIYIKKIGQILKKKNIMIAKKVKFKN